MYNYSPIRQKNVSRISDIVVISRQISVTRIEQCFAAMWAATLE